MIRRNQLPRLGIILIPLLVVFFIAPWHVGHAGPRPLNLIALIRILGSATIGRAQIEGGQVTLTRRRSGRRKRDTSR